MDKNEISANIVITMIQKDLLKTVSEVTEAYKDIYKEVINATPRNS